MTNPKPPNQSSDAVTTPVGVTTMCPQCGTHMPAFETQCSTCGAQLGRGSEDEQRTALRQRLQAGIGDAYELLDMLGKGGMGVVFRAREKALDREVALKVLAFDPIMAPDAFARFEREAKLAARLDHPNIVPIFAVGQGRGIAFYTMRLVRGGSLEELLAKEGKIDVPRAIGYLRDVAAALDHAHAHGLGNDDRLRRGRRRRRGRNDRRAATRLPRVQSPGARKQHDHRRRNIARAGTTFLSTNRRDATAMSSSGSRRSTRTRPRETPSLM